ncbi:MAG: PEP/pyruvate-binding domain-containing protein [Bacteroidales bacterium]
MNKRITLLNILLLFSIYIFSQSYLTELKSTVDFENLCGAPLANKYGNVKAVKIVYDLNNYNLYFINAGDYKNHFEFCEKELNFSDGLGNFLKRNYSNGAERKYLLANLNFFQSLNKYVLEISPTDLMSKEHIIQIFDLVKKNFLHNEGIYFITNSPRLQNITEDLNEKILTISPFEIYGVLSYQAVSKYKNTGILRLYDNSKAKNTQISTNDILILKTIPNYLPPVAGVIVNEFQTPLSHISILGLNRKIPICAYTNIFNDKNITQYIGKQICLTVKADTFLIELDSSEFFQKQSRVIDLELNLNVDSLIDIEDLNLSSSSFVGSKAANFGELYHLSKIADFKTPESAFAIPFYFYAQHIEKSNAKKLIHKLIETKPENQKILSRKLAKIRMRIGKTKISKTLIYEIENKIISSGNYKKFRFRSSTNAEDIEGFSGAGLYTSETGKLNSRKKSIEKAIQLVWASNWSDQAFNEREYYHIDQKNVAMGILVHRSFPKEKVNGVAITKNIYRKNSNGFLVNAQLGNEKVVKPHSGVICDQFLCFPEKSNRIYLDKIVIDVITYSNLNDNKLVMSEAEIQNLANQLEIIKRHFAGPEVEPWAYTRLGYDIEFKLDGKNRQLYIKQIRPYNDR